MKIFCSCGCSAAVLGMMQANEKDAFVQELGCVVLNYLASRGNDAIRVKIRTEGGIARILAAMRAHISHAEVQEPGCFALANLAADDVNRVTVAIGGGASGGSCLQWGLTPDTLECSIGDVMLWQT
eukprot:10661-Rhodomonas_salina.1